MKVCFLLLAFLLSFALAIPAVAKDGRATIVYDDVATEISSVRHEEATNQLWISLYDLKRATRFEMKPQGVCRDELCFPIPKARQNEFLRKTPPAMWFNLTAFAKLVEQPVAYDAATSTWYFGLRADQRQTMSTLRAPNFTLPDINGKMHSLADYRGKKILLVTWASW